MYITECLRLMTKNSGREYITVKYSDLISKKKKPERERTADEIKMDIKSKLDALIREDGDTT